MIQSDENNFGTLVTIDLTTLKHFHVTALAHYKLIRKHNILEPDKKVLNFKSIKTTVVLNCNVSEGNEIVKYLEKRIANYDLPEYLRTRTFNHLLYFASLIDEELELINMRTLRLVELDQIINQIYTINNTTAPHIKINGCTLKEFAIKDKVINLVTVELNAKYIKLAKEQVNSKGQLLYPASLIHADGSLVNKPRLTLKAVNESFYLKILGHWSIALSSYLDKEGIFPAEPNSNLKESKSKLITLSNQQGDLIYDFYEVLGYLTKRKKLNFYKHNAIRKYIKSVENEYIAK